MNIIKVVVTGVGETVMLRYKTEGAAVKVWDEIEAFRRMTFDGPAQSYMAMDDYGMRVALPAYQVALSLLINVDKSLEGDFQYQIDQGKAHQRAQTLAANPPIVPAGEHILNGLPRRN